MIGFIGTFSQFQPVMTAHNQLLCTSRFIPCWTTNVFPSAMMNEEFLLTP
jgi:hypothetical protein